LQRNYVFTCNKLSFIGNELVIKPYVLHIGGIALALISRAEFTHPVIASLDLPSLPHAVKGLKNLFIFPTSFRGRPRDRPAKRCRVS
jgi:hypothetical protein